MALGRCPGRLRRRLLRRDRGRAPDHGARPAAHLQAAVHRRLRRQGGLERHDHARDAAPLHGPRGRGRLPDEPVQHRRRGTALHRRDHRLRRRVLARPAAREDADDRPDVRLRRRGRGDLGADPGRPEGIRADERDHHLADAQLRRRPAAHVHDLRQRVALARRLDGPDALVPAVGRPAAEPVLARSPPGRRGDPVRVPARLRRRRGAVGALPADAVRLRDERHRRLAAGRALLRDADEAEDPRRDGDLRRSRRPGRRQPGRRLLARARRERPGAPGRELRLHRDRRRRARPLQPDRRLPRRRAARRAPERRAVPPGCGLSERPRRRDAGDHPLLHARRRAADPLPRAARAAETAPAAEVA